ncbi:hypothetical protein H072_2249 [Dactylellina haptotyla CBS 200.50]|uniref:Uncharacterized protein n=1 Tax=Dactylellina haptotyla (strain CBS 200.50) TaxID=1284197 RepID=S8BW86_DACHA|nr:hypothetical protein H072_2249 [Dactylellina haptotyla CBS 200.50]
MGDRPVSDTVHPPPAGLKDMSPATQKKWSAWMELVYDTLLHPRKYEQYSKKGEWQNQQLKEIDPTNDLCREDDWYIDDEEKIKNPSAWHWRQELNRFINRNDPKNADKNYTHADPISWPGFPKIMNWGVFLGTLKTDPTQQKLIAQQVDSNWVDPSSGDLNNVFWAADQYRVYQDEYLEWAVTRDEHDRLVKVTFTCEGPEYWQMLAEEEPEKVVELYKSFVPDSERSKITKEALWTAEVGGKPAYNTENPWNSPHSKNGCIAHLIHPNSTLSAEVAIVADGTVQRNPDFEKDAETLCTHGGFGEPYRNSDPKIGWDAYNACDFKGEHDKAITLGEPVGLYMQSWDSEKFIPPATAPTAFKISDCWHAQRLSGDIPNQKENGPWVRVEFYVPPEYGFILEDMKVMDVDSTQYPLRYGAQIAQHIKIGVGISIASVEADKPSYDDVDWERMTNVVKKEKEAKQYNIDRSEFLHYMQYKVIKRAEDSPTSVWGRWVSAYLDLAYAKKREGGDTGKPFPVPPNKTPNEGVGTSATNSIRV